MRPEFRQRVKSVAELLLQAKPGERPALLSQVCGDDAELRQEVAALIEAREESVDVPEGSPPADLETVTLEPEGTLPPDFRIGSYRIVREIGSGGMGVLFEAVRDDQFQKRVAIKIIKRGMDSNAIIRRFHRERQILAGLSHPNITMLFDGGATQDGRPYFVLEYVEGRPITQYCDGGKLSTRERLELFRTVCSAVQYAHQSLVVHRDIKPGNILVTSEGVPKLLDFGIAKILNLDVTTSTVGLTMAAMRVMTPEYASPEQVRGDPITTASDVYSLGVLLYELLTGHRPYRFEKRSPVEIAKVICEQEPHKPSAADASGGEVAPREVRRRLQGDLDNIVLKALQKDPRRRYASVEQFSEDIRRHLVGLPVTARKDTPAYRTGKFIRRHKAGVTAALLVALSMIAGLIATTWQARIAGLQRKRAEQRFEQVRKLANSVVFELHDAIRNLPGSTAARELLLSRALEYLDSLAAEAEGDTSLQREVAAAYERIASVQGEPGSSHLGNTQEARQSLAKAVALREKTLAADRLSRPAQRDLAASYGRFCEILSIVGDPKDALEFCKKSLTIREQFSAESKGDPQLRSDLATGYGQIAAIFWNLGDIGTSLEYRRKALVIVKELADADPAHREKQLKLAWAYKNLGAGQGLQATYAEGLRSYRAALAIEQSLLDADPGNPQLRMGVSTDLSDIGYIHRKQGDLAAALKNYEKAVAIREELSATDPKDMRVRQGLAMNHRNIGAILKEMGHAKGALDHLSKARQIWETLIRRDPGNNFQRIKVADVYQELGDLCATRAKISGQRALWLEARTWFEKGLDGLQVLAAQGALHGSDTELLQRAKERMAECDTALSTAK